jgi:hypothetical protein
MLSAWLPSACSNGRGTQQSIRQGDDSMKTRFPSLLAAALLLSSGPGKADVVGDWNLIMVATVAVDPFNQARFAAITQLAVFEAVNAFTG